MTKRKLKKQLEPLSYETNTGIIIVDSIDNFFGKFQNSYSIMISGGFEINYFATFTTRFQYKN